jgi:hypothetical protein
MYRKESRLIALENLAYQKYLKTYYRMRLRANYIITPLCFGVYIFGFTLLLPYFKKEFSVGFYNYILISGIVSLVIVALIILNSIAKEHRFLRQLKGK